MEVDNEMKYSANMLISYLDSHYSHLSTWADGLLFQLYTFCVSNDTDSVNDEQQVTWKETVVLLLWNITNLNVRCQIMLNTFFWNDSSRRILLSYL